MSLAQPISATVITGFLGAGKTTLIKRLLSETTGKRLALIINEFGDVGIDASMISAAIRNFFIDLILVFMICPFHYYNESS